MYMMVGAESLLRVLYIIYYILYVTQYLSNIQKKPIPNPVRKYNLGLKRKTF